MFRNMVISCFCVDCVTKENLLAFIFLMWWCQYRADHKDRMEMVEMANIRAMNAYEAKRSYGTNA